MFGAVFIFTIVTAHVVTTKSGKPPSYIRVCGRKDPNYDQCVIENLDSVKEKLCTGMPEFNVIPNEPILIEKLVIYDTDNLKLSLKDSKIYGLCNFEIMSVHTDSDRLHFDFELLVEQLRVNTIYNFDIRVLVPLANKGRATIIADNVKAKVSMDLKMATKNNKKEIYVSKVNTNIDIPDIVYEFDDSEKELIELHQAIHSVIDSNKQDLLVKVTPAVEHKISEIIIAVVNNITRSRYEKLFPEQV